ncbi:von Willebrand factor A domain-containing protein 3A, partial [Ophiophagus hannah]
MTRWLFFHSANPVSKARSPQRQKSWQNVLITDPVDDKGLLVTNVNQTQDLMRLKNTEVMFANLKATDDWIQSSMGRRWSTSLLQLSKPLQHERLLAIQTPNFLAKSSVEWLKTNGLRAKKLSLYQVLAPNAFSPVEEFVPVLRKTVSSTLHGKQLRQMVKVYERRIDWLSLSSRGIWGTVCEKRVVVLVDISKTNSSYVFHIQHSLRLLLEEQMASKDLFNILA